MSDFQQTVAAVTAVLALAGVIGGYLKWLRPRWRRVIEQLVAIRDSILGRDAIRDSITGRVIEQPLPGMGVRMDHQERQMTLLARTVDKLADAQNELAKAVAQQVEHGKRLDDHEDRIGKLETAAVERIVARQESAQAWRAVEAAVNASSPDVDRSVDTPADAPDGENP